MPPSAAALPIELYSFDDMAVADTVSVLAGVFLAATVPVLGVFPYLGRLSSVQHFVLSFSRFFEDVATFAMDRSGYRLIAAHLDNTVHSIRKSRWFRKGDDFIMVAHSLGSVVAHNYLVRQWESGGRALPNKLLTFGAPIGLLCWLWRFVEGGKMDLGKTALSISSRIFAWDYTPSSFTGSLSALHWVNVVNPSDPIATAFPPSDVFLRADARRLSSMLFGSQVQHRPMRTQGFWKAASAHTDYMRLRPAADYPSSTREQTFLDYLLGFIGAWDGKVANSTAPAAVIDWSGAAWNLLLLATLAYALGVAALLGFFSLLHRLYGLPAGTGILTIMPALYLWPPWIVGVLATGQRFIWGDPGRVERSDLRLLSWLSPYQLKERVIPERYRWAPWLGTAFVLATTVLYWVMAQWLFEFDALAALSLIVEIILGAGIIWKTWRAPAKTAKEAASLLSFLISLFVPCAAAKLLSAAGYQPLLSPGLDITLTTGAFVAFLLFYTVGEFLRCWRSILQCATSAR